VISRLRAYTDQYLGNQVRMLENQYQAIEKSKRMLEYVSKNPFAPVELSQYLKTQNAFIKVKTSVNYSPDKVENLLWVDPKLSPPSSP